MDLGFLVRAELDSVWLTVPAAWPHLVRSRGCVLTIGSTAGLNASLTNPRTAHSAANGALIAVTRQLAAEGAPHGVRVNCVNPGRIDTDGSRATLLADDQMRGVVRHALPGRLGAPVDVMDAAVFLTSDEAAHITGTHHVVDGGWSAVLPGATA
ncbi:SDR family NAD(P)-dependent oxidoreductase [Streptomyces sp. NPDC008132]|uniref:SDR family NAD(P)-dependent oxidoreductase n=1 Tax=Streptomyces sp. NPDC008132 TaxID=3364812 RepID=UPI0036ECEF04